MQPHTDQSTSTELRAPMVFLSFAGDDRLAAMRLGDDLRSRGFDAFVDVLNIEPAADIIRAINRALVRSDYFVLLWSRATQDRPWVEAEWAAAFERELRERCRSFLFVLRLAPHPLPPLLAPRRCLEAFDGWDEAVNDLVAAWSRDRALALPVLPAPAEPLSTDPQGGPRRIVVYIRNRMLSVAHVVAVPAEATGAGLLGRVHGALALPAQTDEFDGCVGLRFSYELVSAGRSIPDSDATLPALGIADGAVVDLVVQVEVFGPDGTTAPTTYRPGKPGRATPAQEYALLDKAFDHLKP